MTMYYAGLDVGLTKQPLRPMEGEECVLLLELRQGETAEYQASSPSTSRTVYMRLLKNATKRKTQETRPRREPR